MNDLIKKQQAIDALWNALYEYEAKTEKQFIDADDLDVADWILHRIFVQNMNDIDRQTILALPPAQPERKKGRWINKPHIYGVAYCSECDFELHINDTPYCPNCGCRMEGENE